MTPEPLAADYYHGNFQKLIDNAACRYPDLLSPDETCWLTRYASLTKPAQCLLIRLLTRRGELFRTDKLNYPEIPSLSAAISELCNAGIISAGEPLPASAVAEQLMTKPELLAVWPDLDKRLRKAQLLEALPCLELSPAQAGFSWLRVCDKTIITTLCALFFTNTRQDLSQFVVTDLGMQRFESYTTDPAHRYFTSRNELDAVLKIASLGEYYYQQVKPSPEVLDTIRSQLPGALQHTRTDRQRQKLTNLIARDFERHGRYETALELFETTELPPSRERRTRIFLGQNDLKAAQTLISQMQQNPYDYEEAEMAQKLSDQLRRKQGERVPRRAKPVLDEMHLSLDLSISKVELAVIQHLESEGWQAFHLENAFLNGLFGLCLWPAIFCSAEGAFNHPYQHRPLDLWHREFAEKRPREIEQCLEAFITQGWDLLKSRLKEKTGIANPLVNWALIDKQVLDLAAKALPVSTLTELFRLMLTDLRHFRSGQPDLAAFRNNELHLIEVKGPGDSLQPNQIRWLNALSEAGINASVCFVTNTVNM